MLFSFCVEPSASPSCDTTSDRTAEEHKQFERLRKAHYGDEFRKMMEWRKSQYDEPDDTDQDGSSAPEKAEAGPAPAEPATP